MNFISPEAIIENAKYKKDDTEIQLPYKTLVADNFEETMKKYLSNSNNTHYSSAYANDLKLNEHFPNNLIKLQPSQYQNTNSLPQNQCGKEFKELEKTVNLKKEKGISYPEYFTVKNQNVKINIVSVTIIVVLLIVIVRMYVYICKLKYKNKLLKSQTKPRKLFI